MKKKKSIFAQISTMPSRNALKWAGREVSILSSILLWTLWLCRLLSLLQISKLIFRKVAKLLKKSTTDEKSTRINVPPMFCELYFIAWFVFLLLGYWLGLSGPVATGFTLYYLFESIVWVLYYTVFRRFFEENYSIYHELEYLTVLILVIPSQALGFANLYNLGFLDVLAGLLGAGSDSIPGGVQMLGALFMAIVISMIISAFPAEMVKKQEQKSKMFVIGCGDVVKERLYPALIKTGVADSVSVCDLSSNPQKLSYCQYFDSQQDICDNIIKKARDNSVLWIETPSHTHVPYLESLLNSKASLIVVEKPICVSPEDIKRVQALLDDEDNRNRIFFLSYYVLEKALPLYYFEHTNTNFLKYLDISDKDILQNRRVLLGTLDHVEVGIIEGIDTRDWVQSPDHGGQLLETFIHNMLIASIFCGLPQDWTNTVLSQSAPEEPVTRIKLSASSGHTKIDLYMAKNAPEAEHRRCARLVYANGTVHADFDTKSLKVHFNHIDADITISVKKKYTEKYHIVTDLAKRVNDGACYTEDVDGLRNQLKVIEWLLAQQ